MARTAPASKTKKPPAPVGKPARAAAALAEPAPKPAKAIIAKPVAVEKKANTSAAAKPGTSKSQPVIMASAPVPAPKLSKDELRAEVIKLEAANAKLRAKSRETNKVAKLAAKHIVELEERVARLEKEAETDRASSSALVEAKPAAPARKTRQPRTIDPGDAVPPGVAVLDPAPMDEEAEAALENLEHNLHGE
jgi:hypothetical protein